MRLGIRAAFFVVVGGVVFSHWLITDPSHDTTVSQTNWWNILAFSCMLAVIGAGTVIVGHILGQGTRRPVVVAVTGAGTASLANILEDGIGMGWAFFATIAGTALLLLGLLATAVASAFKAIAGSRLFALVPLGTALAIASTSKPAARSCSRRGCSPQR